MAKSDLKDLLGISGNYVPMSKLGTKVKTMKSLPTVVKPTKTIRRPKLVEIGCGSNSPSKYWGCERVKGHKGLHLAWANYTTGQLYEGGAWK